MANDPATNAVRQVLMNELGLTRESVRQVMEEIVRSTVDKHVQTLLKDGHVQRMAESALNKAMAADRWDNAALERLVSEAAGKAMTNHLFSLMLKGS